MVRSMLAGVRGVGDDVEVARGPASRTSPRQGSCSSRSFGSAVERRDRRIHRIYNASGRRSHRRRGRRLPATGSPRRTAKRAARFPTGPSFPTAATSCVPTPPVTHWGPIRPAAPTPRPMRHTLDIPDNAGIAIFNNNSGGGDLLPQNRLDAVGFDGARHALSGRQRAIWRSRRLAATGRSFGGAWREVAPVRSMATATALLMQTTPGLGEDYSTLTATATTSSSSTTAAWTPAPDLALGAPARRTC